MQQQDEDASKAADTEAATAHEEDREDVGTVPMEWSSAEQEEEEGKGEDG